MSIVNHRLERFGLAFYYGGILIFFARFAAHAMLTGSFIFNGNSDLENYWSTVFNAMSMIIPLLSALLFAISAQEGFDRIGNISEGMIQKLSDMHGRISAEQKDKAQNDKVNFNTYKNLAQRCADLMLSEFSDWNSFIKSKGISDH